MLAIHINENVVCDHEERSFCTVVFTIVRLRPGEEIIDAR